MAARRAGSPASDAIAAASASPSSGGTTIAPASRRICAASPVTEPITGLAAARYSNIFDGMNVANSGTSRSGTRQMSAAASSAGTSLVRHAGARVTLRRPSSATRCCSRCLSEPVPDEREPDRLAGQQRGGVGDAG